MAISYLVNLEDFGVLRFRNKRSQTAAWTESDIRVSPKTVDEDLSALTMDQLTALYNTAVGREGGPEEAVNRFKSKGEAVAAAVKILDVVSQEGPNIDPPESTGGIRGRKSIFTGKRLYKNTEEGSNPRRADSWGHKAWDLIEDGMTFEDYMAKVSEAGIPGGSKHLRYDYDRGRVTAE